MTMGDWLSSMFGDLNEIDKLPSPIPEAKAEAFGRYNLETVFA
jgi:hypothetical protein